MPFYHTGLICQPAETLLIQNAIKCIKVKLHQDPTNRYWSSHDGSGLKSFSCYSSKDDYLKIDRKVYEPCLELLIEADTNEEASNYLSLIYAGIYLVKQEVYKRIGLDFPFEYQCDSNKVVNSFGFWERYEYESYINFGLYILDKALPYDKYIYSLEKYKFSLEHDSITPHSTHPYYQQVFENESSSYLQHVNQLMAVFTAYSIIEELGCDIRASQENPRMIEGKWNQLVFQDTISRLKSNGIDTTKKFRWVLRGKDTIIHEAFQYRNYGELADDADDAIVKDRMLNIVEAIQFASYLRNYVAAHKFNDKSSSVSTYDVHNVQQLSRFLLLESLKVNQYLESIE